jgi:hypothetical protein
MDTITDEKCLNGYEPKGYRKRRIPEKKQKKIFDIGTGFNRIYK